MEIQSKGFFPWCEWCGMQCNLSYQVHINTEECRAGTECRHQRDIALQLALALCQQFMIQDQILERVKGFKYLGCLLTQDNNDIQVVWAQLCKVHST